MVAKSNALAARWVLARKRLTDSSEAAIATPPGRGRGRPNGVGQRADEYRLNRGVNEDAKKAGNSSFSKKKLSVDQLSR